MRQTLLILATLVGAIFNQISVVYSANCGVYDTQGECTGQSGCLWSSSSSKCYCASDVTMDICFALDSSGSIGASYFQVELDWFSDFVQSGLSTNARVGIINFSKQVYTLMNFEESEDYTTSELADFILNDIDYLDSYTNTVDAIAHALDMFEDYSSDETTKVFVIMTDGNPKMPNNGDENVCQYANDLKSNDINTYILGVGDNWDEEKVDCLVDDTDDMVRIAAFNISAFNKILPDLTDITCPEDYDVVITEVKVESDDTTGETVPFVEIYNPSFDIVLSDITFSGVVSGKPTNGGTILPQGYYLVLYDGEYSAGGSGVTCEECECVKQSSNDLYCNNSIYIECDGSPCSFQDFNNTNWYLTVEDSTSDPAIELDTVTWDSTFPNLGSVDLKGYTHELKNKGYDNDQGSNWQPSCNIFGTPGADPIDNCTEPCSTALCKANGATNVFADGDSCDCSGEDHYYENGCACELVPPPDNCINYWRKNYSAPNPDEARDWYFLWDAAQTDLDHEYRLCYPVFGSSYQCTTLDPRFKRTTDFDYELGADVVQGTVETKMFNKYSELINCSALTNEPTASPIPVPSSEPTTKMPTVAPTWDDPYLFIGGDICDVVQCGCAGWEPLTCTGPDIYNEWSQGSEEIVKILQRPIDYPYDTEVFWYLEYFGETNKSVDDSTSADTSRRRRGAMRRILSQKFGKEIDLDEITYLGSQNGRASLLSASSTMEPSDSDDDSNDASSDNITPTSGFITVGVFYDDPSSAFPSGNEASIEFTVAEKDDDDSDYELFRLTLHNCSIDSPLVEVNSGNSSNSTEYIKQYRRCNLVYPSELYIILDSTTENLNTTNEEPMPDWVWWLIGGLVLFLMVLAWLVYRYWWKGKTTDAALATTQDEIDQAIAEVDAGIGHGLGQGDVAFNPMASGMPHTLPTDMTNTEVEKRKSGLMNERADVGVQKFDHRQNFGQVQAARHGQ